MTKPKIKLVISDVDGTLTEEDSQAIPSKKVLDIIDRLHHKGIILCFASGRALFHMEKILRILPLKSYFILNGGSQIYDLKKKAFVWEKFLRKNDAKDVLSFLEKEKKLFCFYQSDKRLTKNSEANLQKILKIVTISMTYDQAEEIITKLNYLPSIHITRVGTWEKDKSRSHLHITNAQATKQYAVFKVLKLLKIERKNVLGIGDRENDIPLLAACGVKVAMGNADTALKEIADWVAPPVSQEGFVVAMENFVL